jgi:hypothetical protein
LKNNIELIQNKFLLNNDVIIEIRKVLIEQVVKEDYRTLLFIPEYEITDDIIKFAVENDCNAFKYFQYYFEQPTHKNKNKYIISDEIIKFAIEKNYRSLYYVPKYRLTKEIINFAVQINGYALIHIPQKK